MILLEMAAAARHCSLPLSLFRNAIKMGKGPAYVKPTTHKVFFRPEDLDAWIAAWERREMFSPQNPQREAQARTGDVA